MSCSGRFTCRRVQTRPAGRQNQETTDRPTDRPDGDKPPRAIRGAISSLSWRPAVSGLAGRRCAPSSLTSVSENNELVMFFIPSSYAGGEKVPLEAAQLEGGGGQHDKRRGPEGEKIQQGPREGEGQTLQSSIHPSVFLYGYKYTVSAICKTSCLISK